MIPPFCDVVAEVGAGTHAWRYPLPAGFGASTVLTMDSPVNEALRNDAIRDVMRKHFPGVPLEAAGAHLGDTPLRAVVERLRGAGAAEDLRTDLEDALR